MLKILDSEIPYTVQVIIKWTLAVIIWLCILDAFVDIWITKPSSFSRPEMPINGLLHPNHGRTPLLQFYNSDKEIGSDILLDWIEGSYKNGGQKRFQRYIPSMTKKYLVYHEHNISRYSLLYYLLKIFENWNVVGARYDVET